MAARVAFRSVIAIVAFSGVWFAASDRGPFLAFAQPVPQHAAPMPAPVAAIPVPEIAQRAEDATARLRQSSERLAGNSRVMEVERQLRDLSESVDARLGVTTQALYDSPSASALATLTDSWTLMRARLAELNQTLTRRGTELEQELGELGALRATWSASRDEARASGAPSLVLDRINVTLAALESARAALVDLRARVLRLQDRVVREIARCDDVLSRITQARAEIARPIFAKDSAPIWSSGARTLGGSDVGPRLGRSLADGLLVAEQYFAGHLTRVPVQVAVFVLVLLLVRHARVRAREHAADERIEEGLAAVVHAPLSSALALTLLTTVWIYPRVPHAVTTGLGILILPPVVLVVRRVAPRGLVPAVYALAACFLIDRLREVCAAIPVLGHWVLLVELVFGIGFLGFVVRSLPFASNRRGQGVSGAWRVLGWIFRAQLAMLAVAVFAGAVGSMRLAGLLGSVVLSSDYAGLALYGGVRVGEGVLASVLRARPLAMLGMVQRHRPLIQRRLCRTLRWLAAATWAYFTLDALGVAGMIGDTTVTLLTTRYVRGSIGLSLGDVLVFGATIAAAFVVSTFVRFVLREDVYPRTAVERGVSYALSTLLHYALVLTGFLIAVSALGVDLTRVTILAGAFGVGIGIGLQNVVANFVAGLVLLLEHRIHVGDAIEAGDLRGAVREIGFRATTVRTWTGAEVIVPNDKLAGDRVTNWTLSDRRSRIDVTVTVAYASDPSTVLDVLRKTGEAHPKALAEPAPQALCTGFRDHGLAFVLRVWTARFEEAEVVRSELSVAVHGGLAAAGIEFAPLQPAHIWTTANVRVH